MNLALDSLMAACQVALLVGPASMLRKTVSSPPLKECLWVAVPLFVMSATLTTANLLLGGIISGISACIWVGLALKSVRNKTPNER